MLINIFRLKLSYFLGLNCQFFHCYRTLKCRRFSLFGFRACSECALHYRPCRHCKYDNGISCKLMEGVKYE